MKTLLLVSLLATPAMAEAELASRFSVGLETVGAISLTRARTQGGIGGGVVGTFALDEHWIVQANAAWLVGLGSHTLWRASFGWQGTGTWRPAFRAGLALGLGGSLDFSVTDGPPSRAPTVGLVVSAALLRFHVGRAVLSALEVEGGVSTEFIAVGPRVGVTVLSLQLELGD